MPRFSADTYKPVDDSSPGYRTVDPTRLVIWIASDANAERHSCMCGCGDWPSGKKAKFMMGHDARHRGALIRAHLTGTEVAILRPGVSPRIMTAMDRAYDFDWQSYLNAAVLRREGKNREVLQKALQSERLVKVGRWEFTGQVVAVYRTNREDMFEIEYVNKAGDVKRVRVPADEAPLAQKEEQ